MIRGLQIRALGLLALMATFGVAADAQAQGVTTATITGTVRSEAGEPLGGVQIVVLNRSTGRQTGTLTNPQGRYLVPGLRPGGPYRVETQQIGYATEAQDDIVLALGETRVIDFALAEQAIELEGIQVTSQRGANASGGIGTVVSGAGVERAPSIGREIVDIARFTPQAFVANEDDDGAAISIAGQNNEYNALYIDGVVNNDVFGLSAQGTNGGQTGAPPISLDAIEQLQVAISPYDVTQSGFTGGAINAITRSGTNAFSGSVYYQLRNESLAGKSVWMPEPQALPEFSAQRYGFRLGGPLIENKLFFFVNGELYRSETPRPFDIANYRGNASIARLQEIRQALIDEVGYDPGDFGAKASSLDDDKLLVKLDWSINPDHRLSVRHSYSQSDNVDAFESGGFSINYSNNSEVFPNTTNASALELNSTFSNRFTNKLLLGMTFVRDDRGFAGEAFPAVRIRDGSGSIFFGSEQFSTGNVLNQDILSITNNFNIFAGDHTITIGTHNEFYDIANLFLRQNFGSYEYNSVDDFLRSLRAANDPSLTPAFPRTFQRGFSLVDDIAGDGSAAIGAFEAYQLGFYVQDHWQVNDRLSLSGGIRVDVPKLTTNPRSADDALTTTVPALEQVYDLQGGRPGDTPDAMAYIAPRLGFNYEFQNVERTHLRGGIGVFTGRVPFVYPGAMYLNNGVTAGYIDVRSGRLPDGSPIPFIPDPADALDAADFGQDVVPSGELDIFAADFRYPRVFRTSLGIDHMLPFDVAFTLEGQYTKNLDNILVTNVNMMPPNDRLDGPDNRQVYNYGISRFGDLAAATRIDPRYGAILLVTNYDDGYTYDITASLARDFLDGALSTRFAYTYGDAYSVNDATSDQIWSVWRFNENVNGLNFLEEARSDFSIGHRLLGTASYRREFLENLGTTISAVYTGESGRPFSYIIGGFTTGLMGEPSGSSPLVYIPNSAAELTFEPFTRDGRVVTVAEQQAAFDAFVNSDEYLRDRRGQYTERNASRAPFEHVVDLRVEQEVFGNVMGRRNTISLTLDIFNFTNLLNDDWGRRYDVGFRTIPLIEFEGFVDPQAGDLTPVYTFQVEDASIDDYWEREVLDFGNYGSRWLMQFGARYSF